LSIATFNVQNLSPLDPASKFEALAAVVVNNLRSPDILAVEEIQDNNGASDDGTMDASETIGTLIAAIHTAGGPTYHYRQINPANKLDGGEPGGNIRQIFLFDPLRVTFIDRPGGTTQAATKAVNKDGKPQLSFSPGRLDPTNPAFENSRKPLAGEFLVNGQTVFIIANHLNSKGGDQPLFGRFQPPALSSEVARLKQVAVIRDFVKSLLAIDANANVVVLGDLNDFEFSKPLLDLKGDFLNNLVDTLPKNERYSYVYQGNSQVLDQILVSSNLLKNAAPEYDVVHVNAEFAVNTSDHDPSLARFILPRAAR
jgi:predicted extracellular nuclease